VNSPGETAGPGAGDRAPLPALTVDARGQRCPVPVIMLARRIGEVAPGEVVGVLADDEAARLDVPAWCTMRGQAYVGETEPPDASGTGASGRLYLVRREV
jgi:TusA-related sulfurtransferase